jgi:hypothetical protein
MTFFTIEFDHLRYPVRRKWQLDCDYEVNSSKTLVLSTSLDLLEWSYSMTFTIKFEHSRSPMRTKWQLASDYSDSYTEKFSDIDHLQNAYGLLGQLSRMMERERTTICHIGLCHSRLCYLVCATSFHTPSPASGPSRSFSPKPSSGRRVGSNPLTCQESKSSRWIPIEPELRKHWCAAASSPLEPHQSASIPPASPPSP